MRAINHYRLDGEDPEITAQGHTVFDVNVAKQVRRHVQMSLAVNNALNRRYYETQNYFESRVRPDAPAVTRVHGTPAYPLTVVLGVGFRFGAR
jgi:outer membrane receptor protein involved in Fe transport